MYQSPPELHDPWEHDPLFAAYLARTLPAEMLRAVQADYARAGALAVELYPVQLADHENEPRLVQWDAWGHRVDRVEVTPLWQRARVLAAELGLVAVGYERRHGALSRVDQFARVFLLEPSLDVYSCPLAMTDGAARTLLAHQNRALIDHALPRLTSRDPQQMWTSGQWMTERAGGSDVGLTETIARRDGDGWRLSGTKWFTSAITSEMALTLGRPEGNGPGGRGLALFYLEVRNPDGTLNGIQVNRLKDKLGTRKVPTAELLLDGARATLVAGTDHGVRAISPMLNVTRTWNAVCAAAGMRRACMLAGDYARRRVAFGAALAQKPLHVDTLAAMEAETAAATLLGFRAAELLGATDEKAGDRDELLQRVITPIAKLTTGKQAVAVASEALEACGGAGYVEDTGMPRLLRDAQVLPIWEGTTNVLALDTLRALSQERAWAVLMEEIEARLGSARAAELRAPVETARSALAHARAWIGEAMAHPPRLEAGARRFALTLGRTLALSLLVELADFCLQGNRGPRVAAAARRFAGLGVDLIADPTPDDDKLLVS